MARFTKESRIGVPAKELFRWHASGAAFERLLPPWEKVRVVERTGGIQGGGKAFLEVQQGPILWKWTAVHRDFIPDKQFVDEQVSGPFKKWAHTHQTLENPDGSSLLRDDIDYQAPWGPLGSLLADGYLRHRLERTFTFRHARTRQDLERLHPYAGQKPLRIALTGSAGLVGTALRRFLSCGGHEVWPLVRRIPLEGKREIFWDPVRSAIDRSSLEGMDAVIHLAGENIGAGRWSPKRKEGILQSREQGTRLLVETLAALRNPPKVLLSSSAIGFYGDRGAEVLDEQSPAGHGFLSEVCQAWEAACEPARKAGIRVCHVRTGIVLSPLGGALAKMLPPFWMGGGGVIGSGDQWMSWISLEDLVGIFHFLIHSKDIEGPVNATAPGALTNRDFTKILGRVLGRPTVLPLPGSVVRMIFGEMGQALLLEGQRVEPHKLLKGGFRFLYPELEPALRWELGR